MEVVKVPTNLCNPGEIVAQNVVNGDGRILVSKDTQINKFIKNKLLEWGYESVFVYRSIADNRIQHDNNAEKVKTNYVAVLNEFKKTIYNLASGNVSDYNGVMYMSQLIHDNIKDTSSILKVLNDMREYDEYTYTHCLNTAFYCMLIGKWLKLSESEIKLAIQSGILHDIGKTDIPIDILNKRGILTNHEFEIIKKHPAYGYRKADNFSGGHRVPEEVKKAVLLHHERADGSGYPFKTAAKDIDYFARIVSVADVFDAMTSDRVYKKRQSPFVAFQMFMTVGLGIFDIEIVNAFINNISLYYTDMEVFLTNGSTGRIVYVPPKDIMNPIVKIGADYIDTGRAEGIKVLRII